MSGTLYVVATPIGNLDDLTPRARQILVDVDRIAAEDTRHTGRLLTHIGAKTPQIALHDFNESDAAETLVNELADGRSVALVSDAGTPLISDPGYRFVRAAHEAGIAVVPVPGASALTAALSVAGLATDRFCFEGFLPAKAAARQQRLEALAGEPRTLVFYESVHRVRHSVAAMAEAFGEDRDACLLRELTKVYEEVRHATLGELTAALDRGEIVEKGEFVIVVDGRKAEPEDGMRDVDRLLAELMPVLSGKQAAAIVARLTGVARNAVYERMLDLKERQ